MNAVVSQVAEMRRQAGVGTRSGLVGRRTSSDNRYSDKRNSVVISIAKKAVGRSYGSVSADFRMGSGHKAVPSPDGFLNPGGHVISDNPGLNTIQGSSEVSCGPPSEYLDQRDQVFARRPIFVQGMTRCFPGACHVVFFNATRHRVSSVPSKLSRRPSLFS